MRKSLGVSLVLAAVAVPAGTAVAAEIAAPSKKEVGDQLTVVASELKPGRYSLILVSDKAPTTRSACVARIDGPERTRHHRVVLDGKIPKTLTCWENNSVKLGKIKVTPGRYHLVVAVQAGPAGFKANRSFVRSALRITGD
jgi:hypothetical protein